MTGRARRLREDRAHRDYIKKLPCAVCGKPGPSDPAHVRARTNDGGMGLKNHDRFCVPLCRSQPAHLYEGCHHRQHRIGEPRFWREAERDPLVLAEQLYAITQDVTAGIAIVIQFRKGTLCT